LALGRRLAGDVGGTADQALDYVYVTSKSTNALVLQWGNNDTMKQYAKQNNIPLSYTFSGDCANFKVGCSPGATWDNWGDHYDTVLAFNTSGRATYSGIAFQTLVTHEAGHVFCVYYGGPNCSSDGGVAKTYLNSQDDILEGDLPGTYRHASAHSNYELFPDMYTAWVYGTWNQNPNNADLVLQASTAMSANVSEWVPKR
jgi:hypothetical protein